MRICILNSVHPATDTRVLRVATTLATAGHRVVMFSVGHSGLAHDNGEHECLPTFVTITKKAKGDFRPNRGPLSIILTFLTRLAVDVHLFLKASSSRADVYHCNEADSWIVGVVCKLLFRKAVVFDVHEYYPAILSELIRGSRARKLLEAFFVQLFRVCSTFTDAAIFVNSAIANLYNFRCTKVVVRNCARRDEFKKTQPNIYLREKYRGRLVVLHIGRMRLAYGSNALLEAMALLERVPQLKCLIVGGTDPTDNSFWQKLNRLGLANRFEIVNWAPFSKIQEYFRLADIGLVLIQPWHKNLVYSLGRKIFEYIAAGLPIVASDLPEIRQVIEKHNVGILVDPEDPTDIATALERLALDSDLRRRLGRNSEVAFTRELCWEMEAERLVRLYDSLHEHSRGLRMVGDNSRSVPY